jgi:hypothetical protein
MNGGDFVLELPAPLFIEPFFEFLFARRVLGSSFGGLDLALADFALAFSAHDFEKGQQGAEKQF